MRENLFDEIQSEEIAYLLGFLATSEVRPAGRISCMIRRGSDLLELLSKYLGAPVASEERRKKTRLTFYAPQIGKSLWRVLGRGELMLPALQSQSLVWAFLRGHFDQTGKISKRGALSCSLPGASLQEPLRSLCEIPFVAEGDTLLFYGNNALDFLGKLYEGKGPSLERNRRRFLRWASCVPGLTQEARGGLSFHWWRLTPEAHPPQKERASDSGYDLTLLKRVRTVGTTEFFSTGIQVEPPYGWYFDLVPRSSLSKTGYMMAHSIGIIDRTYRGEIFIPLIKVDPNAAELVLPMRLVQLIPRPIIHATPIEQELSATSRGEKGFGSSDR